MPHAARHPLTSKTIESEAQLRALIGEPTALVCARITDRLNPATRLFVERSPFVDPAALPTGGQVLRAIQGEAFDAEAYDRERAERYRQRVGFY